MGRPSVGRPVGRSVVVVVGRSGHRSVDRSSSSVAAGDRLVGGSVVGRSVVVGRCRGFVGRLSASSVAAVGQSVGGSVVGRSAGLLYVVQSMWCQLCGAIYVLQSMWCNLCGALYLVRDL